MGRSWCPESNHYRFPALRLEDTVKRVFPPNVTGAGWGGGGGAGGRAERRAGWGTLCDGTKPFWEKEEELKVNSRRTRSASQPCPGVALIPNTAGIIFF